MLSRFHHLPDSCAYHVHFFGCEPVSAREVTRGAGRANIALDVRKAVVDPIQTSRGLLRPAIDAGLLNHGEDFASRHIARINLLVCRAKKHSPAFVRLGVAALPVDDLFSLFRGMILPAVGAIVAPPLSLAVTCAAFIREAKRARCVPKKDCRVGRQKLFAAIAVTEPLFCRNKSFSHNGLMA